jgi:two-component system sensor histidine kinase HydH
LAQIGHDSFDERSRRARIAVVVASTVVLAAVYTSIPSQYLLWSKLVQYLFFLPPVMAALWFGWRGAILSAFFTVICYLPRLLLVWKESPGYQPDQYGEALDMLLIGAILGVLADRERRQRQELEATTRQLSQTYRELQDNLEHLKRAERLSAVGQMAAGLAHEIRNPLASIEGAADLLTPGAVDDETRAEFVEIIKKECRRLSRLLTEMLSFARPRAPQFESASVPAMIDSVLTLVRASAHKQIEFRREITEPLPPVQCDPEQIKQVLLNLTMNAVQAMEDGGEITLSASQLDGNIVIEVKDQGPGITRENLDQIFSPFFTTKKSGTGLGLTVAQQIVTRHGGVIMVDPNVPRGTVFSILLPVERKT